MNNKTSLQNLIYETGLTQEQFANKVGVPLRTLQTQIHKNKNHLGLSLKYAQLFGIKKLKGYESDVYFEVEIK